MTPEQSRADKQQMDGWIYKRRGRLASQFIAEQNQPFHKFKGGTPPPKNPILCELLVPLVFAFG